jgi:hypothetical protein
MMAKRNEPIDQRKIQLNELGKQWRPTEPGQDPAAQRELWNRICELAYQIYYPKGTDAYSTVQADDLELNGLVKALDTIYRKFDPEKGTLSATLQVLTEFRKTDEQRKAFGRLKKDFTIEDEDERERKAREEHPKPPVSLDAPSGQDGEEEGRMLSEEVGREDEAFEELEERAVIHDAFYELSAQILNFAAHHNRKRGAETRKSYYQLFYTSGFMSFVKGEESVPYFQHPRDLLAAMKFPFVDFCLEEPECRTIPDIWASELKRYAEVVTLTEQQAQEKAEERIPLPIPDKVGLSYLERVEENPVTKGAYSQKKSDYKQEMKQVLRAQDLI